MRLIPYLISCIMIASPLFAGNDTTFPGKSQTVLSNIPVDSLIDDTDATRVPLSTANVHRLKMHIAHAGAASIRLDNGEIFTLEMVEDDRLIDFANRAEIVEEP